MKEIKLVTTEEEKDALRREIETLKEGMKYDVKEIEVISKRIEQKERWIFEANIKIKSFDRREVSPVDQEPF